MRTGWIGRAVTRVGVVTLLLAGIANAAQGSHDLAGTWQGTLPVGKGERIVVQIAKDGAGWSGVSYDLDSNSPSMGRSTTQMSLAGAEVRFAIAPLDGTYVGKLSEDGATIVGTWTQAGQARPLNLARAEGDARWEIPKVSAEMAKDADPDWEVVTVRPTDPTITNASTGMTGRQFVMENRSVETLLLVGYSAHKKQIVNAPDWVRTERWDIRGVPDVPGQPSIPQLQSLTRKLLTERFGLVTHTEKREMEVYALRVAKGGEKLTPSVADPHALPEENDRENGGQRTMQAANESMGLFALTLKFFLDRPVVDQTGLTGHYDFRFQWTFDESKAPPDGSAAPGVFTAIQEQLGLKLEPVKTETDVLVVDKVERPSAN
jgi:uncharacterized protein (TIGR03435 family)